MGKGCASLKEKGHTVKVIDLPGHGMDSTLPSNVTLQDYADKSCQALTEENYGSIPRFYLECTKDLVITPSAQKKIYTQPGLT